MFYKACDVLILKAHLNLYKITLEMFSAQGECFNVCIQFIVSSNFHKNKYLFEHPFLKSEKLIGKSKS